VRPVLRSSPAFDAYQALAPHYDDFTAGYCHERWIERLEMVARSWGLSGRDVLDVACGTGRSLVPLLARGYTGAGCDLSPAMVERAEERIGGRARTLVADMRRLPDVGRFHLVTCLDDSLNYLTDPADLAPTFRGMARNLAPGGVVVFDANSLLTYRTAFATRRRTAGSQATYTWTGEGTGDVRPGDVSAAEIEVSVGGRPGIRSRHVQRHHVHGEILDALAVAGLRCVAVYGQSPGAELHRRADETRHTKVVYVARQA
jgi:SAM-dependent methyltransferase